MIVPIRASKRYQKELDLALAKAKKQFGIERPGTEEMLLVKLISIGFMFGWKSGLRSLDEEIGKLEIPGSDE